MPKPDSNTYDAAIIGAGIGGLVCGCYLAKAGMKVLIAEQHHKPGGYCTSFKRKGFTFDAAAHSFGGYRKDGIVRKVISDLGIDKMIKINRFDPSDVIITPDYKVSFWKDTNKTIKEFQQLFPNEKNNIKNFFHLLNNHDPKSFTIMRRLTLKDLLDKYFTNNKLKALLSFPIFGNGGLPPSLMSAFIGVKLFSEYILDGGYYPVGGMQAIPDALAKRFIDLGGELLLSTLVKKIRVKDSKITGIILEKKGFVPSKYVISGCDARQTYLKLLGANLVEKDFLNKLKKMLPSNSMFILYLGIDKSLNQLKPGVNFWFLSHYNLDNAYSAINRMDINDIGGHMIHVLPDGQSVLAFIPAPFRNKKYWDYNKNTLLNSFIGRIEELSIPTLSNHIVYKDAATPYTLYKYTLNYRGAAYGWACMPSQFANPDLRKPPFISGFYQTGHWSTLGIGIPGVVYLGYDIANTLIKKEQATKR